MTTGLPRQPISHRTYRDMLLDFQPRPITTEAAYVTVQEEVDRLLDLDDLTSDEQDYLDLLGTLIWAHEAQNEARENYELRGIELVKGLIQLYDLKLKELTPVFKTKSIASAVLNGKRRLTVEQINKLAAFFNLPHHLFFEPIESGQNLHTVLDAR
jgi:HTH-type transcriptional regulator/antitoxin HigA